MLASWWIGVNPGKKLLTASYGQEIADKWGRRVRAIVRDPRYSDIFSATLSKDNQAAARWALSTDAEYYAIGVGGSVTGTRADLLLCDDLVKGREEADSELQREKMKEWWTNDLWTRLKPGAAVVVIGTRWHTDDIIGYLLEEATKGGEQWDVVSLPMEAEHDDQLGRELGEPLWPQWFTPDMITQAKRDKRGWNSLYQQRPTPRGGSIFHEEWWRPWTEDELPELDYVVQSWDTAFKTGQENDFSARTTWGVFWHRDGEGYEHPCAILLERLKERMEYPELKRAVEQGYKDWRPDAMLIEDKASGQSLLQELRRTGVPIRPIKIGRYDDKVSRAHAASPMWEQGCVFYPKYVIGEDGVRKELQWPKEVIRDMAVFPRGPLGSADMTDSAVHAMTFLRRMFRVRLEEEAHADAEAEREGGDKRGNARSFYG